MVVILVFLVMAFLVYGSEGFWEATGYNSAADGIGAVEEAEREQVRAYSIRGMTPFFRESLPLILMSMLGLGFIGEWAIGSLLRRVPRFSGERLGAVGLIEKLSWLVPVLVYSWVWSFFREYEGSPVMVYGMWQMWWAMLGIIVLFVLFPGRLNVAVSVEEKKENDGESLRQEEGSVKEGNGASTKRVSLSGYLAGWLMPMVWVVGLVFFYINWIKFHANYIGEFLPPLVIVSGVVIPEAWRRLTTFGKRGKNYLGAALRVFVMLALTLVLSWALFVSGYVTYMFEHSGTFKQSALKEAAEWSKEHIPIKEPIFTGAAAVPYLSGHHTALDIAHPRWYAYEFTRKDPGRLNTFLPPIEEMLEAYREAKWFLHEKQTGFSFMMEYSEIEAGLASDWERVQGIENGSNTLTFYRRVIEK
jgi:hypothetical protein